jgi:hypothetical protein
MGNNLCEIPSQWRKARIGGTCLSSQQKWEGKNRGSWFRLEILSPKKQELKDLEVWLKL